ncbi:hypothetical protein [Helicobacter hepaticus]|jgi:hypothetical protein|uniref:Uncharacterized protein n=1 Tax=Helicobacter hepaticus (strain ATCC 51449 / 3B1) TaxID=235279 RepID=Q7VI10_HELHP|nr:hypothetical protein [Helicobacter hepaticus]AAP77396.1 hypothetical protein HH_0799 [Helicobacter hepaticus ATCC 51449]
MDADNSFTISRIFQAEHLINDITNKEITFSHPSNFEDMWELQTNHLYFIQCWGINQTDYHWEMYGKNKTELKVVIDNVSFEINNMLKTINNPQKNTTIRDSKYYLNYFLPYKSYFIGIDYSKSNEDIESLHREISNLDLNKNNKEKIIDFLSYKKPYYKFENEARIILDLDTKRTKIDNLKIETYWTSGKNTKLLKMKNFYWINIINHIEIHPLATESYICYVKEKLLLAGIGEEKIYHQGKPIQSNSIDFSLFLETYSKGKIQIVDKMLMAFFVDFQNKEEFSQETRNEYVQNIQTLPEHIVFNMTFNYLNVWLNGGSNKNSALENEVFTPIQNKLKENLEDTKNIVLLFFLAIYLDNSKEFLSLLNYDKGLCKFGTLLQPKEERQLLLEVWQKIWKIDDDNQCKIFCYSTMREFYDRAYKNYHKSKALNQGNPYFDI